MADEVLEILAPGTDDSDDESDGDYVPSELSASEEEAYGDEEASQPETIAAKKSGELTQPSTGQQAKEKQRTDTLWASFMADVGPGKKTDPVTLKTTSVTNGSDVKKRLSISNSNGKVTSSSQSLTSVSNGISPAINKISSATTDSSSTSNTNLSGPNAGLAKKRPGGLSSVLGFINKKQKVSTLDKSHLDWQKYKQENSLSEELTQHTRSKNSYLEKQEFLQRADQKRFEQERDMRLAVSVKRKIP